MPVPGTVETDLVVVETDFVLADLEAFLDAPAAAADRDPFGSDGAGRVMPRPSRPSSDEAFCFLLVEHDMAFVMKLCNYIYVLDFGKPLFEGTPEEVASSPVVQAAYLGSSMETQAS